MPQLSRLFNKFKKNTWGWHDVEIRRVGFHELFEGGGVIIKRAQKSALNDIVEVLTKFSP